MLWVGMGLSWSPRQGSRDVWYHSLGLRDKGPRCLPKHGGVFPVKPAILSTALAKMYHTSSLDFTALLVTGAFSTYWVEETGHSPSERGLKGPSSSLVVEVEISCGQASSKGGEQLTCGDFREHHLFCSRWVCHSSFMYHNICSRSLHCTAHLERGQRAPHAPSEDTSRLVRG